MTKDLNIALALNVDKKDGESNLGRSIGQLRFGGMNEADTMKGTISSIVSNTCKPKKGGHSGRLLMIGLVI